MLFNEPTAETVADRGNKTRHAWEIESIDPVGNVNKDGKELFFMLQRVVGSFEPDPKNPEETRYVPRDQVNLPPIQKVSLKYLDNEGSYKDENKRDR